MKLQEFIVILLLFLESSESNSLGYCRWCVIPVRDDVNECELRVES